MMERREFLSGVLAVALGATVPSDAIRAAVPAGAAPITRRRLGLADVETLEKMTAGIRSATFANGGGLVMSGAVAQVNQARELESVMCSTAVRDRLLVATAELANVAAWTAYDGGNLSAARRLFQYSLDAATRSGDERAADIAVCTFQDMAHMSLHLETAEPLPGFRYAKEALQFMHLAEMRADESPINPVTRGYTAAMIARVQGVLGNADKARRALDESAHAYSGADPENVPRWMAFVTDAEIEGQEGRMLYGLALRDPKYAADAAERLRKAVAGWGSAFGRNAALDLSGLATVEVIAGDLDSGVTNGHRAADAIAGMNFPRGRARLVTLSDVANRHNDMSDVRDLQDHIAAVLAAVN